MLSRRVTARPRTNLQGVSLRGGRRRVSALSVALSLVVAPLTVWNLATPAQAAVIRSFEPVFSANTNGDILMAANTLMTCVNSAGCTTARNATTGNYSNNNYSMRFVDTDLIGTTFNSSSAELTVPTDGTVLFAALVWGGRTAGTSATTDNAALRGNAFFTAPGTSGVPVVATQVDVASPDGSGTGYQSYLDVTEIVSAAGSGYYTLANVQSASGGTNQYAGWSLVVAVGNPSAPARNLTIFTGFGSVANGDPLPTFTVSGFLTPPNGPVNTTLGAVAYEGDMGLTGDRFQLDSTTISNSLNPATNPFNSSITNRDAQVPSRIPAYNNQLGFDADLVSADGVLGNSATSADITLTTGGEQYFPGVVTFATDLYDPKLLGTKTVVDDNGGAIQPGDTLTYTVPVENIGLDTAAQSRFFDAIPTGTTFVPGSITVDGVPQTDAADGADTAEFVSQDNGYVLAYLGAGSTSTSGGAIPMTSGTAQHLVSFKVTIDPDTTNGQELVNAAALTYRGLTTRAAASSATNAVVSPVTTAPIAGNDPPDASPHVVSFTPAPGSRDVDIAVLTGDTDPEGDVLTVIAVTAAAGGTVVVNPDQTVTYAPQDDFAGRDVFTYTIQDTAGNKSTATVQVEVLNTAPDAIDDTATVFGSTPTVVAVLSNDTDANGDSRAVRSVSATTNGGTVTLVDGEVSYTSAPGYKGPDSFTYVLEDSRGGSDTATVLLTVLNNPPVAVDDAYTTATGTPVALDVRVNDMDADGDSLTVTPLTPTTDGALVLNSDGTGSYTPAANFAGTDVFTYRVSDGFGGTDTATVTIAVNGAPDAADDAASTAPGTPVDVPVLANDTDPNEGDVLTVTSATQPAHGTTVLLSDGSVRYTPAAGWAGADTFSYAITDGRGLSDTATVTVTTANTPPVANPDAASTPPDTAVTGVVVLANDTDANISAGVGQTLSVTDATADNGATVVVAGDGTLSVTPAAGFAGIVTVTYTLSDGAGGTALGTLAVTVENGVPTAVPDGPVTTATGTSVLLDVLGNDTDPNGDPLTLVPGAVTTPVDGDGLARGTATIEDGLVHYVPPAGWAGTATFEYTVSDGQGGTSVATVVVVVANAAPVAADDTMSTPSGTAATVDVLSNDSDPNIPGTDQELVVTAAVATDGAVVVRNPDGTLSIDPAPGFKGPVTVTYTVSDGAGGTDEGTLTLDVANAAPLAQPDLATTPYATAVDVDLLVNDTDANGGDVLSVVPGSLTVPQDASATDRGSVTVVDGVARYVPPTGFSGDVTFSYAVTDGTAQSTATVTITVGTAAPVAAPDSASTTVGVPVTISVLGNDTDVDGGTLTVVAVTQPAHGSVAIVGDALVYTPDATHTGAVTFTYSVSDGQGGTATATVTVDVRAVPAPPAAGPANPPALAATGLEVGTLLAAAALLIGAGTIALNSRRRRIT